MKCGSTRDGIIIPILFLIEHTQEEKTQKGKNDMSHGSCNPVFRSKTDVSETGLTRSFDIDQSKIRRNR